MRARAGASKTPCISRVEVLKRKSAVSRGTMLSILVRRRGKVRDGVRVAARGRIAARVRVRVRAR